LQGKKGGLQDRSKKTEWGGGVRKLKFSIRKGKAVKRKKVQTYGTGEIGRKTGKGREGGVTFSKRKRPERRKITIFMRKDEP